VVPTSVLLWRCPAKPEGTVDNFVDGQSLKGQQLSTGFNSPLLTT